jgi:Protein of unknown function (DUF2934)
METSTSKTTSRRPTRRTKQVSQMPSASEHLHERIARRAYELYEGRIRQGPLDDWLRAEREILEAKETRES